MKILIVNSSDIYGGAARAAYRLHKALLEVGIDSQMLVKDKKSNVGILICGSGTGMAISANKIKSIRAAVCYDVKSTRLSRQHNNANIIALGARLTKKNLSLKLVELFLKTRFEGGRHLKRIKKI